LINVTCFACTANVPERDGLTHPYMLGSPGCWAAYGEILAREYQDPAYFAVHRFTVDAYALQHPGDSADARARQSVSVHLCALWLAFNENWDPARIPKEMHKVVEAEITGTLEFPKFAVPPPSRVTLESVMSCDTPESHAEAVKHWASTAFAQWSDRHALAYDHLKLSGVL